MVPFVIRCNEVTDHHLSVFRVLVKMMPNIPEKNPTNPGLTCHEVCDWLLAKEPYLAENLKKVTGGFGERGAYGKGGFDHSWLEFKSGDRVIIDPYPLAVASGPILVYAGTRSPWYGFYTANQEPVVVLRPRVNY